MKNSIARTVGVLLLLCLGGAVAFFVRGSGRSDSGEQFSAHFFEPFLYAPSGKSVLLRSRFEDHFELAIRDVTTGRQKVVHRAPRPQLAISWSPDGKHVIFQQKSQGPHYELYLLTVSSGDIRKLDVPPSSSARQPLLWSPDSSSVVYTAAEKMHTPIPLCSIFIVDPSGVNPARVLKDKIRADALYAWSPDGMQLLLVPDVEKPDLLRFSREGQVLQQHALPVFDTISQVLWERPEEVLLLLRPPGDDFIQLHSLNLSDGKTEMLIKDPGDIEKPIFFAADGSILYHRTFRGVTEFLQFDPADKRTRNIVATDQGSFRAQVYDLQKGDFHGILEDYRQPGQAVVYDMSGKLINREYRVDPDLNLGSVAPKMFELGSGEGRFPAILWEPAPNERKGLAVVVVHGGPFGQELPFWTPARAALLAKGWTVLALNYHGSSGNGLVVVAEKVSREAILRNIEQQIEDLHEGLKFLWERLPSDARIYLEGESYGTRLILGLLPRLARVPDGLVLKSTLPLNVAPIPPEKWPKQIAAFQGEEDWLVLPQPAFSYLDRMFSKKPMLQRTLIEEGHAFRRQSSWRTIQQLVYDRAEAEEPVHRVAKGE